MFVVELAELEFPPFPPPPLLVVLLSRTAVLGTNWITSPVSPRANAGTKALTSSPHAASAARLPNDLDMFRPSTRLTIAPLGAEASRLMQIAGTFARTNCGKLA